jgi:type 1 fimbriae regulatory protein FimB/type 1 fimbriae regulatory protein FimE
MAVVALTAVPIGERRLVVRRPRDREHLIPAEIDQLIDAARSTRWGVRDSTLLLMMFSHGLRVKEATELKWRQVDLDNRVFHVWRAKNGRGGDQRLRGREVRALRALRRHYPSFSRPDDLVFQSERGAGLTRRGVQQMVGRVAKRAGLAELNIHAHMIRHSTGYYLSDRGADLRVIQDFLGHKEVRHTVRYVALSPRRFDGLWDD